MPQNPEDYYYEEGDYDYEEIDEPARNNYLQLGLAFVAGGCLVFLCVGICLLVFGGLWITDSALGLSSPTPIPGSDLGLTFDAPAFSYEQVVNDTGTQLKILEVNRNAQVESIAPAEGREVIIVTIELVNKGEQDVPFNERDFSLLNSFQESYPPVVGAISGALGRGTLPPNEGLEGRLVFEIIAGEQDHRLLWQPVDSSPRYMYLE
jgi:hypothetical protein